MAGCEGGAWLTLVRGAAAKQPPKKRNAMSDPMLGARPQAIWKSVYGTNDPTKMYLRPYRSDRGPHNCGGEQRDGQPTVCASTRLD